MFGGNLKQIDHAPPNTMLTYQIQCTATKYNALAPNAMHRSNKYNAQPPNTISEYIHTAIQDTALNALHFHSLHYMLQLKSNYTLGILSPGQFRLKKTISLITPL